MKNFGKWLLTGNSKLEAGQWLFGLKDKIWKLKSILLAIFVFSALPAWAGVDKESINPKLAKIGIPFVENQGQIQDHSVKFYANTFAGTVFVNDKGEIVYSLRTSGTAINTTQVSFPQVERVGNPSENQERFQTSRNDKKASMKAWALKEKILGSKGSTVQGLDKADTKVNYFIGNKEEDWRSGISSYNSVSLGEIYDGIDLRSCQ